MKYMKLTNNNAELFAILHSMILSEFDNIDNNKKFRINTDSEVSL